MFTWEPSQENENPRKWPEQEAFIPFRQTINLYRIDKTKGFGLGVVKGDEVTRKVRVSLTRFVLYRFLSPQIPISGDVNVFSPPGTARAPLTWEFNDLFQGRRASLGGGVGGRHQCDLPASVLFSNSLSLKYSICQPVMFWGSTSWTPSTVRQG